MKSEQVTYQPIDTLKEVAPDVWIVDSGPIHAAGMPLPVRMTVIRLPDGSMLLHSPTRFAFKLKEEIDRLGTIGHLVAPNSVHWMFLKEWQSHCADALTWAAPGLRDRAQVRSSGVRLDRDLGHNPPEAWSAVLDEVVVPGAGGFAEVAMFHKPSRTLVLTDLVQSFEPGKLPLLMRPAVQLVGSAAPGGTPLHLRAIIRLKGAAAKAAGEQLVGLAPERVIFTHGRWYERDGTARLRRALSWLIG